MTCYHEKHSIITAPMRQAPSIKEMSFPKYIPSNPYTQRRFDYTFGLQSRSLPGATFLSCPLIGVTTLEESLSYLQSLSTQTFYYALVSKYDLLA